MYGLLMGASLPEPNNAAKSKGSIPGLIREAYAEAEFHAGYKRLHDVLQPLSDTIKQWHDYLAREANRRSVRGRPRKLKNDIGCKFDMSEWRTPFELRSQLAAHLLQGREAYFVGTLAVQAAKYGFVPIAHEHDGLVTLGEIPPQAIEETIAATGILSLAVEQKPFAKRETDTVDATLYETALPMDCPA